MISRVFIDRPIFAWVIAIVIMLAGAGALYSLPVEQYPDIAPTSINVRATYPGASADTVESSVTQIIEQQLTGIDGLIYFSGSSSSAGSASLTATFAKGTDPDIAQVQVQNKVQQALARLPQAVQQQGVTVTKASSDFLLIVSVYDKTDRATNNDVSDYLVSTLQDPIGRIPGVGDVSVFGSQYAMRIWLDPAKLAGVGLMPSDVVSAVQAQNAQVAAGQIGAQPSGPDQMLTATVTARSRLTTADQFRQIVLKSQADGARVLLGDVARVELGAENYSIVSRFNGHPAAGIAVQLAPGADALKTAELVKAEVERRSQDFPDGYAFGFPIDSTTFIQLSVHEVEKTLFEAIILVVIVMFVFLQSWRATLIPAIAVPVVLLGTFGILAAFGFSINTLTLFGMVLSIGLLVDDAIVVVENVERVMAENPDISPRDATVQSMGEITTALIAIALVLSAVFLPMAFFGGSVGVIYRQFSVTIVSSMVLSVVVALVLTPALTATLLKREATRSDTVWAARFHHHGNRFNAWFGRTSDRYRERVRRTIEEPRWALVGYGLIILVLGLVMWTLPSSFLPVEDQGRAQIQYTLPPGATISRTEAVASTVQKYFRDKMGDTVDAVYTVSGQGGGGGSGQNAGRGFLLLKPWDDRTASTASADAITKQATMELGRQLRDAEFFALSPPSIRGLGQSNGFTMQLLNTGGLSRADFKAARDRLIGSAQGDPVLTAVRLGTLEDNPTLTVKVDDQKLGALGITSQAADQLLATAWGGTYVNDFIDRGRVKRVYVQGDAPFRSRPEDLSQWYVRGTSGAMAPYTAFATTGWSQAPSSLSRFNGTPSYQIQGSAAEGKSSGDAMARIAALAGEISGTSIAWSDLSYQERLSGSQAPFLYSVSLLVVFLCLAALYESWSIPFAVMLVIPIGLVGAALAVWLRGLQNDVFFQVGLLTTMGLSAKNAILIIEFAEQAEIKGKSAADAAIEAARLRLRPIIMTSLAFIVGVVPLAISTGAGAKSRVEIGTAVVGGMLTATAIAIFLVPLFFVLVRTWLRPRHKRDAGVVEGRP
ncbi:efflux RND transporter permease subunit [Sphingomonas sp. RB1R13]|uniref:efflux RND transporter permease subunit n=1 Tax=Sphingomonas sp. RB1R13 TaxID=3096159 RepID=UPI002FC59427